VNINAIFFIVFLWILIYTLAYNISIANRKYKKQEKCEERTVSRFGRYSRRGKLGQKF
jgi:hypothetical protein